MSKNFRSDTPRKPRNARNPPGRANGTYWAVLGKRKPRNQKSYGVVLR